jgi:hypothetical protein
LDRAERDFLCQVLKNFVFEVPPPTPPASIRWDRLHWALAVNRLIPIFCHALQHENLRGYEVPEPNLEYWQRYSLAVVRKNLSDTRAAVEIARFLSEVGIPTVVIRGISLMYRVYGDPMLRPTSDVDLLIPKDLKTEVVERFAGAERYPFKTSNNQLVCDVDGSKIEIHWYMIKRWFAFTFDFTPLMASPEKLETEWGELLVLSPENELIGVICHGFIHHDMDTLLKILDVALLCSRRELDWDYVRDWAERSRLQSVFLFTLSLVDHLLDTSLYSKLEPQGGRRPSSEAFEPYESRMFGFDRRRDWGRRLATSVSVAQTGGHKLQMVLRFARKKDFARLLKRPFDTRTPTGPGL